MNIRKFNPFKIFGKKKKLYYDDDGKALRSWDLNTDFRDIYKPLKNRVKEGDDEAYHEIEKLRIAVLENSLKILKQGYYYCRGKKVKFQLKVNDLVKNTVFYDREVHANDVPARDEQTIVKIECIIEDTEAVFKLSDLQEKGYNPAALIVSGGEQPGGGVETGAGTLEAGFFRMSNLHQSLYQFTPDAKKYGLKRSRHQYPLDKNFGGIYSPGVMVFRYAEEWGYDLPSKPLYYSFITVPFMTYPDITADGNIAEQHAERLKNNIRTLFRLGLLHGHDSLVVGALRSIVQHNPPHRVARLFHEVMDEPEFKNKYRRIVFCIFNDHLRAMKNNTESICDAFVNEFDGMDIDPEAQLKELEEMKNLLKMWTFGAGNSAMRFNGENPIPPKNYVATKDSWWRLEMPEDTVTIPINEYISACAMNIIKCGHIPQAMEDHWFMYCDENTIRYHRSWSGACIFIARYVEAEDGDYRLTELQINRDPKQYKAYNAETAEEEEAKDTALFMALLTEEYGGFAGHYWNKAF